jgi:hypothetical protein
MPETQKPDSEPLEEKARREYDVAAIAKAGTRENPARERTREFCTGEAERYERWAQHANEPLRSDYLQIAEDFREYAALIPPALPVPAEPDWRAELREAVGRIEELLCAFSIRGDAEPAWITQSTQEAAFQTAQIDAQHFRSLLGEDGSWTTDLAFAPARLRDDIRVLLAEARDRSVDPTAIEMIDEAVALLPRSIPPALPVPAGAPHRDRMRSALLTLAQHAEREAELSREHGERYAQDFPDHPHHPHLNDSAEWTQAFQSAAALLRRLAARSTPEGEGLRERVARELWEIHEDRGAICAGYAREAWATAHDEDRADFLARADRIHALYAERIASARTDALEEAAQVADSVADSRKATQWENPDNATINCARRIAAEIRALTDEEGGKHVD